MNNQQIEKALRLCADGTRAKMAKCHLCPYLEKGCIASLLNDASRYIERLKNRQNRDTNAQIPAGSKTPTPRKKGKPVQEWLKEHAAEDLGGIPW